MSAREPLDSDRPLLSLDGFPYPIAYRWIRLNGFDGFPPWRCIDVADDASWIRNEFLREVARGSIPVRDFLPFARSGVGDDYAGFIQADGAVTGEVCVVHLTFRHAAEVAGYPKHRVLPTVWDWINLVFEEARRACNPTSVSDLESSLRRGG
ncbi:MAG: hypothetical protein KF724_13865 [Phycisphaeraceae bacterium]|nr:hypothetical protein [Phycisphaeraceae bacterium]